jgi:hypothetical protein
MIKAGDLKYQVRFLSLQKVPDDYGTKESYLPFVSCRSTFKQLATKGRIVDGQEITENRYLIKTRKRTDINESMQMTITVNGINIKMNITGVLFEERETHFYGTTLK